MVLSSMTPSLRSRSRSPSPSDFRDAPLLELCGSPLYNPPGTHIVLAALCAYGERERERRRRELEAGEGGGAEDERVGSPARDGEGDVGEHESGEGEARGPDGRRNSQAMRRSAHACPTCRKLFNRPSSLRTHINTHTGALPFVCPLPGCGQAFNVNSNMRRHFRTHRGMQGAQVPVPPASAGASAARVAPSRGRRRKEAPGPAGTIDRREPDAVAQPTPPAPAPLFSTPPIVPQNERTHDLDWGWSAPLEPAPPARPHLRAYGDSSRPRARSDTLATRILPPTSLHRPAPPGPWPPAAAAFGPPAYLTQSPALATAPATSAVRGTYAWG